MRSPADGATPSRLVSAALSADLEPGGAGGGLVDGVDVGDRGPAGSVAAPRLDGRDASRVAFEDGFDAPVGPVGDPARDVVGPGLGLAPVAEEDALDLA
jgi:hypothetical protein